MNNQKGFTLIELLVAIAIIGILSTIVIASLNSSREKAANKKIQSGLAEFRKVAAIYADDNNGYGASATKAGTGINASNGGPTGTTSVGNGACPMVDHVGVDTSNIFFGDESRKLIESVAVASGEVLPATKTGVLTKVFCRKAAGADGSWAIAALDVTGTGTYCVDSLGASKYRKVGNLNNAITNTTNTLILAATDFRCNS